MTNDFYKLAAQLHAEVMKLDVWDLRHRARLVDIANANGMTMQELDEVARPLNYSFARMDAAGLVLKG